MSDAMTNPEIEDILSSIRRLVSEDVRPAARNQDAAQEADKFVLTPALRVTESEENNAETPAQEEQPQEEAQPADYAESNAGEGADLTDDKTQEGVWSALQGDFEAGSEQPEDASADSTSTEDQGNDTLILEGAERIDAEAAEFHASVPPQTEAQDWQDEAAQTLEERIADLEAAVGAQSDDQWEPDGSEAEANTPPSATILQYSQAGFGAAAGLSAAFVEPNSEPAPIEGESFSADEFDDEDIVLDGLHAGVGEEAILDEAALRDLVGTIVREELQGALGERITRNVRRLVRREVQRALSLREFE